MGDEGSVGGVRPDDQAHYFARTPPAPSARRQVALDLPDVDVELVADRGVFSADGLDAGTRLLLTHGPEPHPSSSVLVDLGCGYGPIAVTLAIRSPDATVWAVDVNERARGLCRENARLLGLGGIRVAAPEEVPADLTVDEIWSNPPVRIGKPALHAMLSTWLGRLRPGGRAVLVVGRNLGADSLQRWLEASGHRTERLRARKGYRILEVHAAQPPA